MLQEQFIQLFAHWTFRSLSFSFFRRALSTAAIAIEELKLFELVARLANVSAEGKKSNHWRIVAEGPIPRRVYKGAFCRTVQK